MFAGIQPPAIGRPFSGATMNMPTSAAISPRITPFSQAGHVKRGRRDRTGTVQSAPEQMLAMRGTPNGGTGAVGYGANRTQPPRASRHHALVECQHCDGSGDEAEKDPHQR